MNNNILVLVKGGPRAEHQLRAFERFREKDTEARSLLVAVYKRLIDSYHLSKEMGTPNYYWVPRVLKISYAVLALRFDLLDWPELHMLKTEYPQFWKE